MPADMVPEWIASDGTARIQVFPKDTSNDPPVTLGFQRAVLRVAPRPPARPSRSANPARTIVSAFVEAGILSFIVIIVAAGCGAAARRATC